MIERKPFMISIINDHIQYPLRVNCYTLLPPKIWNHDSMNSTVGLNFVIGPTFCSLQFYIYYEIENTLFISPLVSLTMQLCHCDHPPCPKALIIIFRFLPVSLNYFFVMLLSPSIFSLSPSPPTPPKRQRSLLTLEITYNTGMWIWLKWLLVM